MRQRGRPQRRRNRKGKARMGRVFTVRGRGPAVFFRLQLEAEAKGAQIPPQLGLSFRSSGEDRPRIRPTECGPWFSLLAARLAKLRSQNPAATTSPPTKTHTCPAVYRRGYSPPGRGCSRTVLPPCSKRRGNAFPEAASIKLLSEAHLCDFRHHASLHMQRRVTVTKPP